MTITRIAASKLVISPHNKRKNHDQVETADLEPTILERGLIHAPVAHPMPRGRYGVYIGGRRLTAVKRLIERGDLPKDHQIDVDVRDEPDAVLDELSLIENISRANLPATEEFEAFAALADGGMAEADIARKFATTELHVKQRIRLGRLHPEILAELAASRITLDMAKAYASTSDQELQLRVARQRPAQPWEVRAIMKRDAASAGVDRMVGLVGIERYTESGGRADEDLFSPGEFRILDVDHLRGLYDARLAAERERIGMPDHVTIDFASAPRGPEIVIGCLSDADRVRVQAIDDRCDEITLRLDEIAEWDMDGPIARLKAEAGHDQDEVDRLAAEMKRLEDESEGLQELRLGDVAPPVIAAASIEDGRLLVRGYYRPLGWIDPDAGFAPARPAAASHAARPARVANAFDPNRRYASPTSYVQPEAVAKDEYGLSKDAVEVMRSTRRQVLGALLLQDRHHGKLAAEFLSFVLARGMIANHPAHDLGVDSLPRHDYDPHVAQEDLAAQPGAKTIGDMARRVKAMAWMTEADQAEAFRLYLRAEYQDRIDAAAYVGVLMLSRSLAAPGFGVPLHDVIGIVGGFGPKAIREVWTPDERFLARLPKGRRLAAVEEVSPNAAAIMRNMGNTELTRAAAVVLTGADGPLGHYGLTTAEHLAAVAWVPDYLLFDAEPDSVPDEDPDDDVGARREQLVAQLRREREDAAVAA